MEEYTFEYLLKDPGSSFRPNWTHSLLPTGGGIIKFNEHRTSPFCIVIRPKTIPGRSINNSNQWITLEVGRDIACFKLHIDDHTSLLVGRNGTTERRETVGYDDSRKISYWLSYNCSLLVLKYGKGYCMSETTILEYDFLKGLSPKEQKAKRRALSNLFGPDIPRVIEQYDCLMPLNTRSPSLVKSAEMIQNEIGLQPANQGKNMIRMEGKVELSSIPFTCNWPPIVLDSSKCTLLELDSNNYTLSACLPPACKELYHNIAQPQISLDWTPHSEEYKLSEAIRHSLDSKDGLLHKKLEEKAGVFGGDNIEKTYLRITLGCDRGNSPGIPYVLEIWPKGHFSPIHSHSNSYAVIKVLHGSVTIYIYNKHTDNSREPELFSFDMKQGDITWISPNWYQTHKLWNRTDDYCATVQCYKYGNDDRLHWPYFDYVTSDGEICQFVPDSDFTFSEMREMVLKEYMEAKTVSS